MNLFIASDIHGSEYYCRKMIERFEEGEFDNMILEFSDSVIKDKLLFIASLFGSGETESNRTIRLWKTSALYLDWDDIQNMTKEIFDYITEDIKCEINTHFNFERYPNYEWIGKIAKTMELKD